ncbi:MAG: FAD-dependent oxidoreductase [Oscillospiraceae bacterium]|nr:FAD-dependent oxidoreductase [Oscillospiraceae bacterium]
MKKTLSFVLCACLLLSLCVVSYAEGSYTPGEYEASAPGFGGTVTVRLTLDGEKVVAAAVEGAGETPTVGGLALEQYRESLIGVTAAEEIDGVSGATFSSNAVRNAAAAIFAQASGNTPAEAAPLTDGTYSAEGFGFNLTTRIPVTVVVKDGELDSVEVGENGETNGFIQTVVNTFIPRLLANQSLAVDALTGATATCNGVRQGVEKALSEAGMDLSGLYTPVAKVEASEEYETDVLVVGMGSSGTTAALAAAEAGVKVLAIDKAAKWGGTGATTSGPANVNPPSKVAMEIAEWEDPIQGKHDKAAGELFVDADALYDTWVEYTTVDGVQGAKPEMIAKVINESGETCDWLEGYGFAFGPPKGFVGGKWAIFSSYVGGKSLTESYFETAYAKYTEMGGEYMLETEATDLLFEDGRCVGVRAVKADGTEVTIHAKAVLCCTGGYGGSQELQKRFQGEAYKLYGMYTNDGKMIASAVDNGAATYSIGIYPMSHFVAPAQITTCFSFADNDIPYGLICTAEGMAVNREGNRFIDESSVSMQAFYQGSEFYYVYSAEQIDVLREQGLSANASGRYLSQGGIAADVPLANIDAVIDHCVDAGFAFKAASLDELAAMIGGEMSAENLKASVAGYTPDGDAFGKDPSRFERLGTVSPESEYYVAFTGCPYIYSTCGGLDVNENFQVLDTEGQVMPGLFACGTDSMGVLFNEDKAYTNYGGCAQGYCFVSGRDAGSFAAQQILEG